jgi:sugar/nucleoside kinase (ribokinase family)
METPRILVVGNSVVDVIGMSPDAPPRFGELVAGRGPAQLCVGGNGAIAAAAAAVLGADTSLASTVGNDSWGRWLQDRLMTLGVDVSQLRSLTDGPTSTTISLVRPDGERALLTHNGVAGEHDPRGVDVEDMPEGSWLLVGAVMLVPAYSGDALDDLVERAFAAGLKVAIDLAWDPTGKWDLDSIPVDAADLFMGNDMELVKATRAPDVEGAIDVLLEREARAVVAKLGQRGARVAGEGRRLDVPAPKVRALNSTGTGDVFNGALMVALSEHRSLPDAISFACAAGALRVSGGSDQFPTRADVESILARNR